MKVMFLSDIHGIKTNIEKVKEEFLKRKCDKLVVLGDLFYIGPRNQMNKDYDIEEVLKFLNSMKDKIICIEGNCDSKVDHMVCEFPIVKELSLLSVNEKNMYLTHGDFYNKENWNKENTILIYGHFHIPFIEEVGTNLYINPGSISLPKNGNNASYMIFEENKFTIYDIFDNKIAEKGI